MPSDSRTRMISFRLSAEEYNRFRELCLVQGIRSVSEMIRAGIHLLLQQPDSAPQPALETRVAELEQRLHALSLELKHLHQSTSSPADPNLPSLAFGQSAGQ